MKMPPDIATPDLDRIRITPSRAIAHVLAQLSLEELAAYEMRVIDVTAEEISSHERKAPGYLASRIIAQVDERPLLACAVPAYVVGGREFLSGGEGIDWPDAREEAAAQMRLCFSRIAAGHRPHVVGHPRHDVRVLKLVQAFWFSFWIKQQAALARDN
ncbi:hypothetical protein [Bradyrhizobium sp. NP1]|uniref:hypothetical protein n=1 Tax=Bradyrhizobium sp. NP1 TaxID=3049772 RepID=UPI0025A5E33C|nr:hypothetical protein [Bradyrhizobium sp. NP1]WJR78774.1 hypothetical protein QOU61_02895 [Bradyrhizobium sp. NP1]